MSRDGVGWTFLVIYLTAAVAANAEERAVPRQPIGPQDFQMLPAQKSPLPRSNIRIINKGDQRLSFSYWDGRSAWQPLSIGIQETTEVSCSICDGTIVVVYHDGTQNQRVSLEGGGTYWIGWSASRKAWLLSNPLN